MPLGYARPVVEVPVIVVLLPASVLMVPPVLTLRIAPGVLRVSPPSAMNRLPEASKAIADAATSFAPVAGPHITVEPCPGTATAGIGRLNARRRRDPIDCGIGSCRADEVEVVSRRMNRDGAEIGDSRWDGR